MGFLGIIKALFSTYDASEYSNERSTRAILGDRSSMAGEDTLVSQFERDILIRQCRDIYRNNPIARGIVKRMCDMVVGQGITPLVSTTDSEWNKKADTFWRNWCKAPEPTEMQSFVDLCCLMTSALLIEGGSAILLHSDG